MIEYPKFEKQPNSNYDYPPLPPQNNVTQSLQAYQTVVNQDGTLPPYGQPVYYDQPPPQQILHAVPMPPDYPPGFTQNLLNLKDEVHYPSFPISTECPNCRTQMITRVEKTSGCLVYGTSILCCAVGLVCGCCLIPFMMDSCKNSDHYCSRCNKYLGSNSCQP